MTDSGNNDYHRNNDLGGRQYSEAEQHLIYSISAGLRGRDPFLSGKFAGAGYLSRSYGMPPDGVRPRDYIPAYTKVAGFVYELAKNLQAFPFPPSIPKKSLADWIRIVTDLPVYGMTVPIDGEPSGPNLNGDVFPEALPETRMTLDEWEKVKPSEAEDTVPEKKMTMVMREPLEYMTVEVVVERGDDSAEDGETEAAPRVDIEAIDPEKAKAILIRLCDSFPGLIAEGNEPVSGGDLLQELTILLHGAATPS